MKKVMIIALFVCFAGYSSAQQTGSLSPILQSKITCGDYNANKREKILSFGFNAGVNRSNLNFGATQQDGDLITNGLGYRLGVISNLRITKRFSIAPKAELSFNSSILSRDNSDFKVNATNLELIAHLKYKFRKGRFSPYIIAGPNFRVPVNNISSDDFVPTKQDLAVDVGVGLDVPLGRIKIAPELRYSFGLADINRDATFSDLKYHNITLVLNFSE
jgi:hypothetical protein